MDLTDTTLSRSYRYKGRIVNLRVDEARLPDGGTAAREVVEHPGGVCVAALTDDGELLFVRQFRYPFGREMLEVPAGKLERGEDPRDCAVRELSEETGFSADELIYLGPCCTSPGFSTEVLHIYLARGLHSGKMHLDPDEFLNVEKYKLSELEAKVMSGEIDDAKTIIAVLKARKYLEAGR